MIEAASPMAADNNCAVSPGCPCCPALQNQLQLEKEASTELKTSIDRLNAQVSYHIFSNTQLQRELDKAKGKNKHNEEAKEIMRLKHDLAEMEKQRNEAQNQPPPASNGASEEALRRAQMSLRSLKKELREAQESRDDAMKRAAQQCEDSDALDSKWKNKYEAEQGKSSRLQKELDDANSTLEKLRAEMNNGSKQKEDKAGALQKQLAGLTKELKTSQDQLATSKEKLTAADAEMKQVLEQLKALQQQQADSQNTSGGVEADLRKQIEKLQKQLEEQKEKHLSSAQTLKSKIAELEKKLKEMSAAATESAKQLKQLEKDKVQLGAEAARFKKEGDELRADMAALRNAQESDADGKLAALQKQLAILVGENEGLNKDSKGLKDRIAELEKELALLRRGSSTLEQQVLDEQARGKKAFSEAADAKKQLTRSQEDLTQSKAQLGDTMQQLNSSSKRLRECEDKSSANIKKLKSAEAEQQQLAKDKKRLEQELRDLESTKNAMLDKANKALERLKSQVLQMTCQGLLRLCVVAPRVTIAFEMKNINVSALLPSLEIHDMLEKELLPKYTKVFLQPGENLGPEGEEMEKWLQGLLKDMETKIEQKLVSVLNENVPQGSVVASSNGSRKR